MPNPRLLRIQRKTSDNSLELRIMFLTGLSVILEGEKDRHEMLIEADRISREEQSQSEVAAMAPTMETLLQ